MISQTHSEAARRNGKLFGGAKPRTLEQAIQAFWSRVEKGDGCWNWNGAMSNGYGHFCYLGKAVVAHRFAYEATVGSIPPSKFLCHTCDNRACVRPDHMFVGDAQANNADCRAKGRNKLPPTQQSLLDEQTREYIRRHFVPFKCSAPSLAKRLNVSLGAVKGAIYGHYKGPRAGAVIMIEPLNQQEAE